MIENSFYRWSNVTYTARTIKAALEALHLLGRAKIVMRIAMVFRDLWLVPIQPDFCWCEVQTSKNEIINLRLNKVDGKVGVFYVKKYKWFIFKNIRLLSNTT